MRPVILLTILISILTVEINAQQQWTLKNCVDYALTNNLQVKRQQLQTEIAENNNLQSKLQIAPRLNAFGSINYNRGRHIDETTNEYVTSNTRYDQFGLSASMNVFNGLQTYNTIKKNEYSLLASVQGVEREKIDLTLEISTAYLNILFKEELLAVNEGQMGVTTLQVERTKKLVEAGSLAKGNLLEIKAQLASEKLNVTNAKNQLDLAYLNLTQLLDLDSISGFKVYMPDTVEPDLITPILTTSEVYNDALTFLPHIKESEYFVEANKRELSIQKGKVSPQLYVQGGWGTNYSSYAKDALGFSYNDQLDLNEAKTFTVGLSVPLFNQYEVVTSVSNAKIRLYDSEYQLDQTKQQLFKEIQQAYNDAQSSKEKYSAAIEAVQSYSESFKYTEQKFNVGMVNSVEYSVAKNNYLKAQSDLSQAKYEYIFQTKILEFYRGTPLGM